MTFLTHFLVHHAWLVNALACLLYLIRIRHLAPFQHWLGALCWVGLLMEGLSRLVAELWTNNLPLLHGYIAIEWSFLWVIFVRGYPYLFSENQLRLGVGIIVGTVVGIATFGHGWMVFPDFTRVLESLTLLGLTSYILIRILQRLDIPRLERHGLFWVCSATMLYLSGNLLIFIFQHTIFSQGDKVFMNIWSVHGFVNLLLYTFYAIALLCPASQPSTPTFSSSAP
jgi:hypothetical protein